MTADDIRGLIAELDGAPGSLIEAIHGLEDLSRHDAPQPLLQAATDTLAKIADWKTKAATAATSLRALLVAGWPNVPKPPMTAELQAALQGELAEQGAAVRTFFTVSPAQFLNLGTNPIRKDK